MRRLPIYFLIDVSESMAGEPVKAVENGMRTIIQDLRQDPYALETAYVSIIAFAGKAKTLSPLTELYAFYPPNFPIGGGTALGSGLNYLMDSMDRDIVKTTHDRKGDWKPIIFLFTDGTPTDDSSAAVYRWNEKYRRHCNLVAVSIGDNINTALLGQLTDNVLLLKKTTPEAFKEFFKWISASIKSTSMSVGEGAGDDLKLPSPSGINLEKVDGGINRKVDENYAVLLGKCQNTKQPYLLKFGRRFGNIDDITQLFEHGFGLVGTYPIDWEEYQSLSDGDATGKQVAAGKLAGRPTCPCCGNQMGLVVCACGKIFCMDESGKGRCPWCREDVQLAPAGEGGGGDFSIGQQWG